MIFNIMDGVLYILTLIMGKSTIFSSYGNPITGDTFDMMPLIIVVIAAIAIIVGVLVYLFIIRKKQRDSGELDEGISSVDSGDAVKSNEEELPGEGREDDE